jgi:DNA-binding CsgD family transcriptional regulator
LAIELAAARMSVLSPEAIRARLEQHLGLPSAGPGDLPTKHPTLRGAIAWSESLLDGEERTVFRRLSVFVGGFTVNAAEVVAMTGLTGKVSDVIAALVRKNLVRHEPTKGSVDRFGMLETIRDYALEQLTASSEMEATQARHVEYCLSVAEHTKALFRSKRPLAWIEVMGREYENLKAALSWAAERGHIDAEARLTTAMCRFWSIQGNAGEGYKWIFGALTKRDGSPTALRASLLHGTASFASQLGGDLRRIIALEQEALALARQAGDREMIARSLMHLGLHHNPLANPSTAKPFFVESLTLSYGMNDRIGLALRCLGLVAVVEKDLVRAARLYGAAEALLDPYGMSLTADSVLDRTMLGRSIVTVLLGLGREVFGAAWAEGREMQAELVLEYALGRTVLPDPMTSGSRPRALAAASVLSTRELHVAELVAQGLSNREIGRTLVISERTVDAHLRHILDKLEFTSRAQVAAWVAASQAVVPSPAGSPP